MGEGLGGGDKIDMNSEPYLITLPLIPSHQGRGNELSDNLSVPLFQRGRN
jgi:hypothetical protein